VENSALSAESDQFPPVAGPWSTVAVDDEGDGGGIMLGGVIVAITLLFTFAASTASTSVVSMIFMRFRSSLVTSPRTPTNWLSRPAYFGSFDLL
jgi:hypothetical protein